MKYNWFENATPPTRIILSIALMAAIGIIVTFLSFILAIPIFHKSILQLTSSVSNFSDPLNYPFLKYLQIFQSIGIFLIPPFLLVYLFGSKPADYLYLHRSPGQTTFFIALFLILAILPFINYLEFINSRMTFPPLFKGLEQWMRNGENAAARISEIFLKVDTTSALFLNLFMMAILPAIGEELVFRGLFQRLFTEWFRNIHWGIIVSAALFSAIHFQFYGFIPRMLLGVIFGYLLVWSGSLWVPIIAHFVNNALGVVFYFLYYNKHVSDVPDTVGTGSHGPVIALISALITGFILFMAYRYYKGRQEV